MSKQSVVSKIQAAYGAKTVEGGLIKFYADVRKGLSDNPTFNDVLSVAANIGVETTAIPLREALRTALSLKGVTNEKNPVYQVAYKPQGRPKNAVLPEEKVVKAKKVATTEKKTKKAKQASANI